MYYGVTAEPLREHMLFTALACEALRRSAGSTPQCLHVGLMRTIGMLVLDRVAERLPQIRLRPWPPGGYPVWEGIVSV